MKKLFTLLSFLVVGIMTMTNAYALVGFSNLYMVGNATPSGWNIATPVAMIQDTNDPSVFTWVGPLVAGELKISSFTGDWCDGIWINPSQADQTITATDYIYTNGCEGPDNKWLVSSDEGGQYKLTVNLGTETINFEKLSTDAGLSNLSLNVGILSPFFKTDISEYEASVPEGTTSVDLTIVPNDILAGYEAPSSVDVSSGSGTAVITVTAADGITKMIYTVNIFVRPPYFENLYLVGSASPVCWNIGTPEPMFQDFVDTMIFRWEGYLIEGELKFSTFAGDWCDGAWIKATVPNQVLSVPDYMYTLGCADPDNKWFVGASDAGYYYILINLRNQKVVISTSAISSVAYSEKPTVSIYPNPASDFIHVNLGSEQMAKLSLYSSDGRLIYKADLNENTSLIKLDNLKTSGLVFVKVSTVKTTQVFKLILE